MNMRSIAKLAGVSLSTVSKAFSGSREISEQTRQKIFAIAKEHGLYDIYNKNKFEKRVIAVICPEVGNEFYTEIIQHLDREIKNRNGIMLLSINNFNAESTNELITYYTAYCHVDGIICICPKTDLVNPSLIPGVVIFEGSHRTFDGWTFVRTDIYSSIKESVFKLKELGHTDIGFACEDTTRGKLEDFKRAMRNASLPLRAEWICKTRERFEDGGEITANIWMDSGRLPTAVIVSNDYKAMGMINTFKKRGLRVPEDISVIGMDDIRQSASFTPSLSSIRVNYDEVCKKSVELITKKIDNQYYNPLTDTVVSSKFISRGSISEKRKDDVSLQ